MHPTITHLVAEQHINDLLREAEHNRLCDEVRTPYWAKLASRGLRIRRPRRSRNGLTVASTSSLTPETKVS